MLVKFKQDYRGVLTAELFYLKGEETAAISDSDCARLVERGIVAEVVEVEVKAAAKKAPAKSKTKAAKKPAGKSG